MSPLPGNPHIFTSRIDVFWLGGLWVLYVLVTTDDLLFYVGFLYLAILRVLLLFSVFWNMLDFSVIWGSFYFLQLGE